MTETAALRLALALLTARQRALAFDANLHDRLGVRTPECVRASQERQTLLAAHAVLSALAAEKKTAPGRARSTVRE